jgi:mRNA interferase RelE/StbE
LWRCAIIPGFWRYRLDDYRIVASIEDDRFVLVMTVGHRREVYR